MSSYKTLNHAKYTLQDHLIWCPKFRFSVLQNGVEDTLKEILLEIAHTYKYEIKVMEMMPDHIHLLVSTAPTVAPTDVVRTFKSLSAIELFKHYLKLKGFYGRCGSLWSKGYFVSTVGSVSEETVRDDILNQKTN